MPDVYEEKLRVIAHRGIYKDPVATLRATVLLVLTGRKGKDWTSLILELP